MGSLLLSQVKICLPVLLFFALKTRESYVICVKNESELVFSSQCSVYNTTVRSCVAVYFVFSLCRIPFDMLFTYNGALGIIKF